MTTSPDGSKPEGTTKLLTDTILKGDEEQAARVAAEISLHRTDVNDVVDAISDTMNIVADLHGVERYNKQQVEDCQRAAERALEALRPNMRVEQRKISGKVMVASLEGDPHSFDKTLLTAMLEIGGFTPLDGGTNTSPQDLAGKVKELHPDVLAVPLLTDAAAKSLMEASFLLASVTPKPPIVAYGKGTANLSSHDGPVEEDTLSALSRIAELLIMKS